MCKRTFWSMVVVAVVALLSESAVVQGMLLEGRVLEGDVPDETKPIEGVTVDLYVSNSQADKGTRIATTTTDPAGRYELPVPDRPTYDYYNIVEQDPAGYVSVGATTEANGGVKIDNNWIQYTGVAGKNLIGNKFWDKKSQTPPPPAVTLSGWVYEDTGKELKPLSGATVELYGSNNQNELGTPLRSDTSDSTGYSLNVPASPVYEYYNIVEKNPDGYTSSVASTVGGTKINNDQIQYRYPLQDKVLTENNFMDIHSEPLPHGEYDFGDAPDPCYPTKQSSGGAGNRVALGPYYLHLGSTVDGEPDGNPDPAALGDDNTGVNDEDGVTIPAVLIKGQPFQLKITIPGKVPGPVCWSGWIDWNGNGVWEQYTSEEVINSSQVPPWLWSQYLTFTPGYKLLVAGTQTSFYVNGGTLLIIDTVQVPPDAKPGITYARFRVQENSPPLPTGVSAEFGEVEDYMVEIKEAGSVIAGFKFNDLNGDGQFDSTEPRLGGWTIWLDDNGDGKAEKTTTTDASGSFSFGALGTGTYTVWEEEQPGWKRTMPADPGTYTAKVQSGSPKFIMMLFGNTPAYDFGDAPEGGLYRYPTMLPNGARHKIVQRFCLGADVDGEPDGIQSGDAQGDDNNNRDDEDGVLLPSALTPGTKANITVTVTAAAPVDCYLDAWVDFNCNGDWQDPGEQIFASKKLTALSNPLSFSVPADAVCDVSFARFRLSKKGGLSCDGEALDGEVEDYPVEINPAVPQPPAPRPPMGHPKWSQPPVEIGRDGGIPVYSGWNEPSGELEVESNLWFDCWNCPKQCRGDGNCDGIIDMTDVVEALNIAYMGAKGDPTCYDFNRDGKLDIDDAVVALTTAIYGGTQADCPGKPIFRQVLADDWLCKDERPVTDIHWWCSFIGWTNQRRLPPVVPEGFHIGIWTNVPEGEDPQDPFSHPGSLIWENMCTNWTWRFAGYDLDPRTKEGEKEACFEFTHLLSQDEWFKPDLDAPGRGKIYWLSITPIYEEEMSSVEHPWGWKTRPHFFADDAVRIFQSENAVAGAPQGETYPLSPPALGALWVSGEPITWGGESWDLAFELTSNVPDPDKPGRPDLNGDGIVDLKDFAIMARWWLTPDP